MPLREKPWRYAFLIICLLGAAYVGVSVANAGNYIHDQVNDTIKLGIIIAICIVGYLSGRDLFQFTRTTPVFVLAMAFLIVYHLTELTEEFVVFQSVPLFGEVTLAKKAFETILMIGSICLLLGGIYLSVSTINQARKQLDTDVAQRKQTERALREYEAKLRSLASALSLAEERERRRIAIGLHDEISQELSMTKITLQMLRDIREPETLSDKIEDVCNDIDEMLNTIRSLTFELSSPILYDIGLGAAVESWLESQLQTKHGIDYELETDPNLPPISDELRVVLYRDIREVLTNIVKHAQAKKVEVSLQKVNDQIEIVVTDDGVGLAETDSTEEEERKGGFGLFSVREQLRQLGGTFEIETERGRGTRITMRAPLENKLTGKHGTSG